MKKVLVRKMVKKEEMSNNIKTKYTVQMKYANEGQVNCHKTTANNNSCLYVKEPPIVPTNPSPP